MLQNFIVTVLIFLFSGMFAYVFGQTPETGVKPTYIAGDVVAVGDKKFVVSSKTGQIDVVITEKSVFKRVSAENPILTAATPGAMTDIGVGDKLTVSGILSTDGKSLPARSVYFMTKADITAKNAKESEAWRVRGITGRVVSVNPQTNQITITVTGLTAASNTVLTPKENAKFLRYAQDSVRFDEAKGSSLAEVKVGDMLRAMGDKSSDGASFAAEQIVAGAFQTTAGTVKSIDVAKNEVIITNLQTKKDVTVAISDTSVLKRFPAEMAERMAGMQLAGGARPMGQGGARPPGQGGNPGGSPGGQTPGGGRGGFGSLRPSGGLDDMFERLPAIAAVDLKVGDMIAISSTKNGNADRVKAIKLVAGVEPFLRLAQATNGGRRGAQGGVEAGFSIPGLDGIGFP